MPQIKEGTVNVVLPEGMEVPAKAGTMSDQDVRELSKVRTGVGLACIHAADELEKATPAFSVPGVTAAQLRTLGEQAEKWDEIISDLALASRVAQQANLLTDSAAFEMLRKVNNQVKAQSPFEPKLKERFAALSEYFASARRAPKTQGEPQG